MLTPEQFATALANKHIKQADLSNPAKWGLAVAGEGAAKTGLLGAGVGGLVGLLREAYRKRDKDENSDYLGSAIRNAVGGAAIGGLGGAALGGTAGYGAGKDLDKALAELKNKPLVSAAPSVPAVPAPDLIHKR